MTSKPKPGLVGIEPPKREPAAMPATQTIHAEDLAQLNVRITEDRAGYVRLLSAKTRTPQRELIERAIDLLRKEAGEI